MIQINEGNDVILINTKNIDCIRLSNKTVTIYVDDKKYPTSFATSREAWNFMRTIQDQIDEELGYIKPGVSVTVNDSVESLMKLQETLSKKNEELERVRYNLEMANNGGR